MQHGTVKLSTDAVIIKSKTLVINMKTGLLHDFSTVQILIQHSASLPTTCSE